MTAVAMTPVQERTVDTLMGVAARPEVNLVRVSGVWNLKVNGRRLGGFPSFLAALGAAAGVLGVEL